MFISGLNDYHGGYPPALNAVDPSFVGPPAPQYAKAEDSPNFVGPPAPKYAKAEDSPNFVGPPAPKTTANKPLTAAETLLLSTQSLKSTADAYSALKQQPNVNIQRPGGGWNQSFEPRGSSAAPWILGGIAVVGIIAVIIALSNRKD